MQHFTSSGIQALKTVRLFQKADDPITYTFVPLNVIEVFCGLLINLKEGNILALDMHIAVNN